MRLSSAPGYLLKSMFISLLLIMSVSVTLDTVDINQIMLKFFLFYDKNEYSKCSIYLFLQNTYKCSCSPRTDVVKVVPETYSND